MLSTINAFFRFIRIGNLLIIALSLSLFYYLVLVPVHHNTLHTTLLPLNTTDFILFVLSVMLIAAAGNIINDYFDFELDREYKPGRPLASGKFTLDFAMYLHGALAFAGIGIGFYLGWSNGKMQLGYIYIICTLLLYVYSSYLKKLPLVGNIVVAALSGFVFVLLLLFEANFLTIISFDNAAYAMKILLWQVYFYGGFAFITSLAREIVKDIEDAEGDAAHDINTLAVQFGANVAKAAGVIVLLALLGGIGYFAYNFYMGGAIKEALYMGLIVGLPVAVVISMLTVAKQAKQYTNVSLLIKVIMLLGILSIPAFYLFSKMAAAA